jgi:hypothetical protein
VQHNPNYENLQKDQLFARGTATQPKTAKEEEDEEDPEWLEFDPDKTKGTFIGREMKDGKELKEKVLQDREANMKAWNSGYRGAGITRPIGVEGEEDEFDKLVKEHQA